MSWIQKLCEVYDFISAAEGNDAPVPIGFISKKLKYNIIISESGCLLRMDALPEEDQTCIIPSTPQAEGRTGDNGTPFPLADQLKYLLPVTDKPNPRFEAYLEQLGRWVSTPDAPPALKILYDYLSTRTLTHDICALNIPGLKLHKSEAEKDFSGADMSAMTCFSVQFADSENRLWMRKDIRQSWSTHFQALDAGEGELCYASGQRLPIMQNHPKISGNAKLISAKDAGYPFQYKGRFSADRSAAAVSIMASSKAHSALRWLLDRQGFSRYGLNIAAWNTMSPEISEDSLFDDEAARKPDTFERYALALRDAAFSRSNSLAAFSDDEELSDEAKRRMNEVVILAMHAATTGRMSIIYYQELPGNLYVQRLNAWQEGCQWEMPGKERRLASPTWRAICEAVMGTEQVGIAIKDHAITKAATKQMRELQMQLLNCTTNANPFPQSHVNAAFHRALRPHEFINAKGEWQEFPWLQCVATACALIRKQEIEQGNAPPSHILDAACRDRDYLFGRLLAAAYKLELDAGKKGKETFSYKAMTQFAQRPCEVWQKLYLQLIPYISDLGKGQAKYYASLFGEIERLFIPAERFLARPAAHMLLIGFSAQLRELYTKAESRQAKPALPPYAPPSGRDELYGCLLAIAERCEHAASGLKDSFDARRCANVPTLMRAYTLSPCQVWHNMHDKLIPSFEKLGPGKTTYFQKLIRKIEYSFSPEDRCSPAPLGFGFVHGYLCMCSAISGRGGLDSAAWEMPAHYSARILSRSAAYGALAAIDDRLERLYLDANVSEDENRLSNALRILPRVFQSPQSAIKNLDCHAEAYARRVHIRLNIEQQRESIHTLITEKHWDHNAPLSGDYLNAFYTYNIFSYSNKEGE